MAAFRDIAVWAQTLAEIAAAPNQATRNGPPIAQALSSLQKIGFQDLGGAVEAFRKHGTTLKDSIEATYAHMPPEVRNKVEMVQGRLVNAISSPGVMEFLKRVAEWTMGVDDAFKKRDITLKETARTTYRQLPHEFRDEVEKAHSKVYQIEWNKLAVDIQNWIKAHPYQTAFYVMNGIVFFAPAASSGPVLWTLGFSDKGPKAASFASMLQRKFGTVGAKGIFAHTQSAAMGGYGVTAVDMVTRLGVAASSLLGGMWGSRKSGRSFFAKL
ncbi:hypothetical protein BCIN_12g03410 [Botrytis cinerea B05.10]|uniref:Uncharacterized protein n=2 Tax=Botryotinia fuckeliana TaxID=40559 RepID=A0A384JYX8_BOTFB|nr:hypothetical protein BCIN_12g03410 [Botrytis cinerea B05.10]ATZ55780.1 hypothetical protein BCIN_12g03410 [Botrytis cinerea B05.10]EMR87855.1 hypothetical protein BcDW1_3489 [Botrytis cinerea BcDW1]